MKGLLSLPPFVLLITILPTQSPAQDWDSYLVGQVGPLTRFERDMRPKIQVGMTPNEVKQILGRPKAIEGGFPKSSKSIIIDFPEQTGQMNNSTWFYFYPLLTLKVSLHQDDIYLVNGFKVPYDVFLSYREGNADSVYSYHGVVLSYVMGKSPRYYGDNDLKVVPRDVHTTVARKVVDKKVIQKFTPIVAVIFDKGTQVVAATKVFFLIDPASAALR